MSTTGGLNPQNPQMDGANYILAGYTYSATQNNGQITSMQDGREGYSVTYQYDLLKRLTAATAGSTWAQTFGYDGFGNLTSKSTPSGSSETPLPSVNPAKNWLTGYTYDQNGNVGSFNNFSLNYDPANRLATAVTGSFTESYDYDAANHRIERINSSADTVYFFAPSGKLLSMFNCLSTCTPISNRVYFGGMLLGTDGTAGQGVTLDANFDTFTWTDRLGSAQPTYPYGADIGTPAAGDAPDFATYTKEGSTGLEYAMNRYYSGGLGRFMTVDPLGGSAHLGNPGSWNRYSYSWSDPVGTLDPSGLDPDCADLFVESGPGESLVFDPTGDSGYTILGQLGNMILGRGNLGLLARVVYAESSATSPGSMANNEEKGAIAVSILDRVGILDGMIPLPPGYPAPQYLGWGPVNADLEQVLTAPGQYASVSSVTGDIQSSIQNRLQNDLNSDWQSNICTNLEASLGAAFGGSLGELNPILNGFLLTSFHYGFATTPLEGYAGSFGSLNNFFGIPVSAYTAPTPHVPPHNPRIPLPGVPGRPPSVR